MRRQGFENLFLTGKIEGICARGIQRLKCLESVCRCMELLMSLTELLKYKTSTLEYQDGDDTSCKD